jgi:copper chaperone CopZ
MRDTRLEKSRKGYDVKLIAMMVGLGGERGDGRDEGPGDGCAACTVVIKKALTQTKGIKNVDLNVDKRTATIVYEDTQVTQAEIQKTIEKAGFKTEQSK